MMRHQYCQRLLVNASRCRASRPSATNAAIKACLSSTNTHTTVTGPRSFSGHTRGDVLTAIGEDDDVRNSMAYSLAFAALDGYNRFPPLTRGLNFREREQIRTSMGQLQSNQNGSPVMSMMTTATASVNDDDDDNDVFLYGGGNALPRTVRDALRPTSRRAIVITETTRPFRVVDVNKAWEDLCGYTYVESKGKSLGSLLKGPETDPLTVTALVNQLLRGEEATAIVTNYTKEGRKFLNRLHVGPLFHDDENDNTVTEGGIFGSYGNEKKVAYFIGVLSEVSSPPSSEMTASSGTQ